MYKTGRSPPQLQEGNAPKSALESTGGRARLLQTGASSLGAAPGQPQLTTALGTHQAAQSRRVRCVSPSLPDSPPSTLQSYSLGDAKAPGDSAQDFPCCSPSQARFEGQRKVSPDLVKSPEAVGRFWTVWWIRGSWLLLRLRLPSLPGQCLAWR